jgi:peptidoglycan-associated lipoprotein
MKTLTYAVLMAAVLAGCAETPSQDASIEDRAIASKDAKKAADAKAADAAAGQAGKSAAATQAGADATAKPAGPAQGKVETRGLAAQETEVKALDGSKGANGANGKPIAGPNGAAGTSAGPVLDPKNPASPLVQRRILFDYDSSAIRDEYRGLLEAHAQYLKKEKAARAILQGHADERGSREYNLALGQRRAESVYKALNLLGVPDAQIEAVSLGEEKPVAEGHDEEAWKQNRRTEILYQGE